MNTRRGTTSASWAWVLALTMLAFVADPARVCAQQDSLPRPHWARSPSRFVPPDKVDANTLWKLAHRRDTWTRLFAANAINRVRGMEVIHPARKLAEDDDPYVRAEAVRACAPKNGAILEAVVLRAASDRAAIVRLATAEAMGKSPKARWVEPLLALSRDPARGVRLAALRALVQCGEAGAEALVSRYAETEPHLGEVWTVLVSAAPDHGQEIAPWVDVTSAERASLLVSCGRPGVQRLLELLSDGPNRPAFLARRALVAQPRLAAAILTERIDGPLDELPTSAVAALIQILVAAERPDLAGTLAALARDRRPYVRAEIMRRGRASKHTDLRALFVSGLEDPNPEVAKEAIVSVGTCRAAAALPFLLHQLQGPTDNLLWSVWAVGELGSPRSVPALIPLLNHPRATIRQYACEALEKIGDAEASPSLIEVMDDDDAVVRYFAQRALLAIER